MIFAQANKVSYGSKIEKIIIAAILAIVFGKLILRVANMQVRWNVSFILVVIILCIGLLVKNSKHFYLSLFFLSLPVITYNFIGNVSSRYYGVSGGFYNTFYDFPLLILYLLWIPQILITKTAKIHFSKLDFCMLGLIGMSFLSIYNAVYRQLCLYEIFRLIIMYLIFFYMTNAITTKRDLKFIVVPILVGLFAESLLGIFQYRGGQLFGLGLMGEAGKMATFRAISRVGGTLRYPNNFAIYLGFFLPLAFILLFAPIRRIYKTICGLIFLVGVSTLILTLSRGGWTASMVSMVVLFILGLRARLFSLRRAIAMAVVAIILLSIIIFTFQDIIFMRLFSDDYGAAWSRIPLMKVAISIIKAHPLLGIGINNYAEVMQTYDNTIGGISFRLPYIVHNSYLLIASEIGIIGLLFFLWFVVEIYKRGIRLIFNCDDKFITCIAVGILTGISAFLIHITIENLHMVSQMFFIFWVLSGLIVAFERIDNETSLTRKLST